MDFAEYPMAQPRSDGGRLPLLAQLPDWVVTVDHKRLGIMYICTGLVFFAIAGIEASIMRWQLAFPNHDVVSPAGFNRLFPMHGTTMVFFVGMPIILGLANYLVPLMIGARDLAFPRLNALGFWLSLCSGLRCSLPTWRLFSSWWLLLSP
jgi:cytochrome c oxidase subunit I